MAVMLGVVLLAGSALGALGSCGGDRAGAEQGGATATPAPSTRTPTAEVEVVARHPHDRGAFTQGLLFHQGRLFESTGQVGTSGIREVELTSGRVMREAALERPHFGEGIVIVGDRLFQLTWQSGKAFVYDWKTFRRTGEFRYDGEGWGLTTDGSALIMSTGGSSLLWRDPATFAVTRTLPVTDHGLPVSNLNELEWVEGEIWANLWQSDQLARINPATGEVTGYVNLAGILPASERSGEEDVLNGIAYDPSTKRLLVTGKLWPTVFEIRVR
jgi:glutamine cyclotransferase